MKKSSTLTILTIVLLQLIPISWAWQIERPRRDIAIPDRVESVNTNGEASVSLGVTVDDYDENASQYHGRCDNHRKLGTHISINIQTKKQFD
jgi:hypothetical protein